MEPGEREKLMRLLLALARGGTIEEAARDAGISVGEAHLLVAALVSAGYLERLKPPGGAGCPCDKCPLRAVCGGRRAPGAYVLTKRGRRLLASLLGGGGQH